MANIRNLTYNEIEKLTWKIQKWCSYDTGRGGYNFYDVEVDDMADKGQTFYTIRKNDGSVKCIVRDYTDMLIVVDASENIIYYEDEKVEDNWINRHHRVIEFKNPESKVARKEITDNSMRIFYRNGEIKVYNFEDEEA